MTVRTTGTWIALAGLMLVGLWLRLRNLGALALIADEGIQAFAVRGILEHGYPLVPSGEVYLRSPLFLYLQAASADLFGLGPFALRLPSALFGVCAIPATYALGRTLFDRTTGLLAAAIVALSAWEIELSRYARFYALFQVLFVLSAIFFYRGFVRGEAVYKVLFAIAALMTIPTHRLSLLLAILFIVPWVLETVSWRRRLATLPWIVGLTVLILYDVALSIWLLVPERPVPETGFAPEAAAVATSEGFWMSLRTAFRLPGTLTPELALFDHIAATYPWAVAGLATVMLGLAGVVTVRALGRGNILRPLLLVTAIACGTVHQFGVTLALLAVYVLFFADARNPLRDPSLRITTLAALIGLVFWMSIGLVLDTGLNGLDLIIQLLGYPAFGSYFLAWYVKGWPILTVGLVAGTALLFVRFMRDRSDDVALFTLTAIYLLAMAASMFVSYREARYTYHFHPLVVVLASYAAVRGWHAIVGRLDLAVREAALAGAAAMTFALVAGEANPAAAWRIGERTYSSEKNPVRSVLSWPSYADFHQDFESPGQFVARNRRDGELVVAYGAIHMGVLHHYYSGGLDLVVVPSDHPDYYAVGRNGVLVNNISGVPNVEGSIELAARLARHDAGAWILADRRLLDDGNEFYIAADKRFLVPLAADPDFVARDGETFAAYVGPPR